MIIPADFLDLLNPEQVTGKEIKVSPAEMSGNFNLNTMDSEVAVETVYCYQTLSTADNIPGMFPSTCFTEYGVDTAAYLVIKPTGGYGILSGGTTTDLGKPDRKVLGKPL